MLSLDLSLVSMQVPRLKQVDIQLAALDIKITTGQKQSKQQQSHGL